MAIPVVDEILSFLQSVIQAMPRSMKYIMFLVFLILMVAVIPFFLHIFGIHCNHEKQVMSTPIYNFIGNLEIATADPQETFNSSKYAPQKTFIIFDQRTTSYTRYIDNLTREYCTTSNTTGCQFGLLYKSKLFSNEPACINCTNYTCSVYLDSSGHTSSVECVCLGTAIRKSNNEMNIITQTLTCNEKLDSHYVVPPQYYIYDNTDNTFTCINTAYCGAANSTIRYAINDLLNQQGAKPYYTKLPNGKDYSSAIMFSCDNNIQPQITLYKIPIFNLQIWIGLFVLGLLFFFLNKIKRH